MVKYEEYQMNDSEPTGRSTGSLTGKQQAANSQLTPLKEGKKVRRKELKEGGRFTPPTPEEVKEYAESIDYNLDGNKFIAHYEANQLDVARQAFTATTELHYTTNFFAACDSWLGLARICQEENDLAQAAHYLETVRAEAMRLGCVN